MAATRTFRRLALAGAALALSACSLLPTGKPPEGQRPDTPADGTKPSAEVPTVRLITAQTPAVRAWRKTGARHLYNKYPKQIYKGRLPPLMHAVVVVETEVDAAGRVTHVSFSRTPGHAPEVPARIATLIRQASPFPSPGRLGAHTYVDTWLWDKSGRFQLDTLTEGQRSR